MRFSIAKLILATVLINVVVSLTFAVPVWLGFPLLTFISLVVIPPAMLVGAVNTRGPRQAFFLGCMLSGTAHFIISVYLAVVLAFDTSQFDDFTGEPIRYIHLFGYTIGLCGGLSGVGMFHWLKMNKSLATQDSESTKQNATGEASFATTNEFEHSDDLNDADEKRSPVPR